MSLTNYAKGKRMVKEDKIKQIDKNKKEIEKLKKKLDDNFNALIDRSIVEVYSDVETIGKNALASCTELKKISFSKATSFQSNSFSSTLNLEEIEFLELETLPSQFASRQLLQKINFPKLKTITPISAFQFCASLKEVNLPLLETTAAGLFVNCTSLEEISLPKLVSAGSSGPNGLFAGCTSLKEVNLPLLEETSNACFKDCTSLEEISLPKLETIPINCFNGCTSLKEISLALNQVVTLADTNAIPSSQNIKIKVPSSLIDTYKVSNNWQTLFTNGDITFEAIE